MNIHELNTKTPAGTDYLAFDDGTDTYKAQAQNILSGADLAENNVTFTTDDTSGYPTGRKTMSPLFSSGTLSNLMAYISTAISNLRFALNRLEWQADRIGTGSISSVANSILEAIGDTSIGGVSLSRAISNILDKIGNTAMGTTATTITGAIAEHESNISTLNSNGSNNAVSNANNAINTGILYSANDSATNTPYAAYWTLWVRKFSSSHMTQYALLVNAAFTVLYARSMGNGTWGAWAKVEDTRPVSLTNGVVTTATPTIRHKNGTITIEFALQIPARTYTSSNALWTINRQPSGTIHFIAFIGPSPAVFRLTNSGEIVFNSDTTLSSTTWMIGHVTYPSD